MKGLSLDSSNLSRPKLQTGQSLNLRQGQIFQGQVMKLFPQSLATLRIGDMNVTARLEAALSTGQSYTFQVKKGEGIPRLQVLDSNTVRPPESQAQQAGTGNTEARASGQAASSSHTTVLSQLGLGDTRANQQLLSHLQREQVPFTREQLQQGADMLQQMGRLNAEGMRTVQTMIQRELPLTATTFQSVQAATDSSSLAKQLAQLQNNLSQHLQSSGASSQEGRQLQAGLDSILRSMQLPAQSSSSTGGSQSLVSLLQAMTSTQVPANINQGAEQLARRIGLLSEGMGREAFLQSVQQNVLNPSNQEVVRELWPSLSRAGQGSGLSQMEPAQLFNFLMSRLTPAEGTAGERQLSQLSQLLPSQVQAATGTERLNTLLQQNTNFSSAEQQVLTRMLTTPSTHGAIEGTNASPGAQLQQLFNMMGLGHERQLGSVLTASAEGQQSLSDAQVSERLKPLLLQHMQQLPDGLRLQAEQLVHRLTGQQLLSTEQQGPLQQTTQQIPLQLGNFQTDLTMQWEGRRQKDGSIHPDHARVLFYLELEQLGHTVVDVQIQNRIVSVQVLNDEKEPKTLLSLLKPFLQEQLQSKNYQLSGLSWKQIQESGPNNAATAYQNYTGYEGVDVRV
ncbi:hypothetical protein [Salsuginibacillus kocurii]|uniref:hypothetical protein n=1 Tax=Salsuginibacillus kocurii TaxID=427078 RepID=UPI0003828976|nr:hypothetical protein [Salsuginibacillus kocurii]